MKQYGKLGMVLCGVWVATLLYGEMFAFWVPSLFSTCSWPHLLPHSQAPAAASPSSYVKVAVIADPQLMDRTSLHLPPNSLALEIAEFYTDINMRRAFFASILPFKPDTTIFLGDFFDGGPYLSNEEWQASLHRFKHIFGMNQKGKYADKQVYFIPGNHDIGYASINTQLPEVVKRYEAQFGARNFRMVVGNVEFIAVDAQTLDGHPLANMTSMSWEFVKSVSKDVQSLPRVLLTHIPLYRPDHTTCGPHRSYPTIDQRILRSGFNQEIMYQNYVTEESSRLLLDLINPVLVLSGHDHDQCTVTHRSNSGHVTEHTLGTISWQQGNLYPSFMLLSISNTTKVNISTTEQVLMAQLCFLPMQTHIYIWYLSLFALTLFCLLFWPKNGLNIRVGLPAFVRDYRSMFSHGAKEKNDDDDCEYDMIWDAEGSMHLVKKPLHKNVSRRSDGDSIERGSAVLRSAARSIKSQDMEGILSIDTNADVEFDRSARLLQRTGKSRPKMIIHKLLRTLRMLIVIAVVNVPLYVMMLFKDWIDSDIK